MILLGRTAIAPSLYRTSCGCSCEFATNMTMAYLGKRCLPLLDAPCRWFWALGSALGWLLVVSLNWEHLAPYFKAVTLDAEVKRLNISSRRGPRKTVMSELRVTYVGCHPYSYHSPGSMTNRFFLYLSPNSLRYFFSLPPAHTPIWPTATRTKSTVLQLQETSAIPIQAMASNI